MPLHACREGAPPSDARRSRDRTHPHPRQLNLILRSCRCTLAEKERRKLTLAEAEALVGELRSVVQQPHDESEPQAAHLRAIQRLKQEQAAIEAKLARSGLAGGSVVAKTRRSGGGSTGDGDSVGSREMVVEEVVGLEQLQVANAQQRMSRCGAGAAIAMWLVLACRGISWCGLMALWCLRS